MDPNLAERALTIIEQLMPRQLGHNRNFDYKELNNVLMELKVEADKAKD
jgi:hypothetical protein